MVAYAGGREEVDERSRARALVAAHLAEEDRALAPRSGGRPSTDASTLSFSMPFCSERTIVSRVTTGAMTAAVALVS